MSYQRVIGLLAMTALIAGCSKESGNANVLSFRSGSLVNGGITLLGDEVTLHVQGTPDAVIHATGDLSIDRHPAAVSAAQRALLQDYYRNVQAVNEHGIVTGKAGAAIAGQAIKSVAKGIANGDPDSIGKDIDAKSQEVTQEASKICQDLANIKTAQDNLAVQFAAFKPYAGIIKADNIADCTSDSKD